MKAIDFLESKQSAGDFLSDGISAEEFLGTKTPQPPQREWSMLPGELQETEPETAQAQGAILSGFGGGVLAGAGLIPSLVVRGMTGQGVDPEEYLKEVSDYYTYQPKTRQGQEMAAAGSRAIMSPFEAATRTVGGIYEAPSSTPEEMTPVEDVGTLEQSPILRHTRPFVETAALGAMMGGRGMLRAAERGITDYTTRGLDVLKPTDQPAVRPPAFGRQFFESAEKFLEGQKAERAITAKKFLEMEEKAGGDIAGQEAVRVAKNLEKFAPEEQSKPRSRYVDAEKRAQGAEIYRDLEGEPFEYTEAVKQPELLPDVFDRMAENAGLREGEGLVNPERANTIRDEAINKILQDITTPEEQLKLGWEGRVLESQGEPQLHGEGKFWSNLTLRDKEHGGDIYKEPGGTTLTAGVDPTQAGKMIRGLKTNIAESLVGRGINEISQWVNSPYVVFARDPVHGKPMYKLADNADLAKMRFLSIEGMAFEKALKKSKIKVGSEGADRIGMALDGQIKPDMLPKNEKAAYDFFKTKYDFLIKNAAQMKAKTPEVYAQAVQLASRKEKPMVKVSDLTEREQKQYKGMNASEKRDFLHDKWKDGQAPELVDSYTLLSSAKKDYLPHLFLDREVLREMFEIELRSIDDKLRTATNQGAITGLKNRMKQLEEAIVRMDGGGYVKFDALPRNVFFKHFMQRKGKEGYSYDAVKAYTTYLAGYAKKMYDEPALQAMGEHFKLLDPSLKPFAQRYMDRFAGRGGRGAMQQLADNIAAFEWIRTLGFNPRSAIANLTQRINTIAEIGAEYSAKGYKAIWTKEGKAIFDATGLANEVPQVLWEGGAPKWENLRMISGWLFNKVELGNRRHAFMSAFLKGTEKLGMSDKQATQYAIDMVHKTQFRYGRVGMPLAFSNPIGRVAGQFMSYPIKQLELLSQWAKHDKKKLIAYLAMAEGGNLALQEFLDTDLHTQLGTGVRISKVLNMLESLSKGEIRDAYRHVSMAVQPGGGLLPSGFGPAVTGAGKVLKGMSEGKGMETLGKELSPVMATRMIQAYKGVKGEEGGQYPVIDTKEHPQVRLTGRQMLQRTVGPRTSTELEETQRRQEKVALDKERKEALSDIVNAIVDGDNKTATSLINRYEIVPTSKQINEELKRRMTTRYEREQMKKPGKKELFEIQREGRIY